MNIDIIVRTIIKEKTKLKLIQELNTLGKKSSQRKIGINKIHKNNKLLLTIFCLTIILPIKN